jgi:hypothetical protein
LLTLAKQNRPQNKAVWKTAESSGKRAGFGRRRKRMSGGGEAQMMRRIVDYGRLTETKREKDPVSRSFKRRNIEKNKLPPLPQLSKHPPHPYSFQNSFYQLPFYQLWLPASAPAHTRAQTSAQTSAPAPQLASRRSSLISTLLPDREILKRFFDSKIQDQPPEVVAKIKRGWRIVYNQDWTVNDLKTAKAKPIILLMRLASLMVLQETLHRNFGLLKTYIDKTRRQLRHSKQ